MMWCDEVLYAKVLFARHGVLVLYAILLAVCNHHLCQLSYSIHNGALC